MSIRPLFLLSLPRTGSTLLQRLLSAHPKITSAAEPWILLPLLHGMRTRSVATEYDQHVLVQAIDEFCLELPNGQLDLEQAIREFAVGLYTRAADQSAVWFLDKTPAYCLIATDLLRVFPDARFLVLWRDPIAQVASVTKRYGGETDRWAIRTQDSLLHKGLDCLVRLVQAGDERVYALKYEDLVENPERVLSGVFLHLGLDYEQSVLDAFKHVRFKGTVGDPTGIKEYSEVSAGSLEKWRRPMASWLRKRWISNYLNWIGPERLAVMGYDHDELCRKLATVRIEYARTCRDVVPMLKESAALRLKHLVLKHR
jgi:hypothetical protein